MKKILLLLVILTNTAFGKDVITNPKIKSATVYMQGAELNYNFTANIPSGNNILVVTGLPGSLNPATIQIGASNGVVIQSSEFKFDYIKQPEKSKIVKALEDSAEILNDKKNKLLSEKQTLTDEITILYSNKSVAGANVGLSVAELQKLMDYFHTKSLNIKSAMFDLDNKIKKLDEKLNNNAEQLQEENAKANTPNGQLVIQLMSKTDAMATFDLSFIVPDAGWTPLYDIRCENIQSNIKLIYKAQVYQNTGLAWDHVRLSISTGNPNESGTNPVLQPWYLTMYDKNVVQYKTNSRKPNAYSTNQTLAPAPVAQTASGDAVTLSANGGATYNWSNGVDEYTTITESQLNATFDIDLPYDIPNDGKVHLVTITEHSLPATYTYYAVPKLDKDAFLLARITDWEKLNLISANANIFFENNYIGQSFIDPINTKDTLSLSLGRDKKVIIKRQKVTAFCSSKLIGTNKKETFTYDISIRNAKKENIPIIILDQYPLAQNSEVEVELLEDSKAEVNTERAQLKWDLKLNASESKTIRLSYSIKYPKDKVIGGL